jgi:tRNA pseudouridine(38-40) synthase
MRTVEGEIDRGIGRHRLPLSRAPFAVASRTDRGVSARGNAFSVSSPLEGRNLLRSLNGISPELCFTAAYAIPESFRVRSATRRVYRYFETAPSTRSHDRADAAALFRGAVDARSFGTGLPTAGPQWRTVEYVRLDSTSTGIVVEVSAPSFVRGMVRKIIAALREVEVGRLTTDRLADALAGKVRLTLPIAEPEPLVLWEVEYPFDWTVRWQGPNRHQAAFLEGQRAALRARSWVVEALASAATGSTEDDATRTGPR